MPKSAAASARIVAGTIIGYTPDIARFPTRASFASYNGTAPIEVSSGGRP